MADCRLPDSDGAHNLATASWPVAIVNPSGVLVIVVDRTCSCGEGRTHRVYYPD